MLSSRIRARSASWLSACLLAGTALAPSLAAAHGSHTHGHGSVRLAIDGQTVTATFEVPLEAFLGYDYPPQGAAQEQLWSAFKERLGDPLNFVEPAPEAQCTVAASSVTPDVATVPAGQDIVNVTYSVTFLCARAEVLKSFSFTAFRDHPGLRQLRVQLLGDKLRKTVTVRPRFPAVTL